MRTPIDPDLSLTGNLLLDALPREERKQLVAKMRRERLRLGQVLAEPDRPTTRVHFPVGVVISLITTMSDGSAMETAMVGREGIVGIEVFLGNSTVGNIWAITQVPGEVLSLSSEEFEREVTASPELSATLRAFTNALLIQEAQAVACARLHSLDHRLSRLLLMTQDRAGTDEFPFTQESMSDMLGVHRPSVTLAARALHEKGLIRYHRGSMTILNRDGLAHTACECYSTMTSALGRLTGAPGPPAHAPSHAGQRNGARQKLTHMTKLGTDVVRTDGVPLQSGSSDWLGPTVANGSSNGHSRT
jgi:CRP-like cAMP-binding protein